MTFAPEPVLTTALMAGGLTAAFLHAALPTHWLPFVLVGRAQGWSRGRLLWAVLAAGLAHTASTAVIGGLMAAAGLALERWMHGVLPWISAGLMFALGGHALLRARRMAVASGPDIEVVEPRAADSAAFWGLVVLLAASPGETLLPLYLSAATSGWPVLAALTVVFAAGTIAGMSAFTLLARAGASLLRLERWARHEGIVLGLALIALGVFILVQSNGS